MEGVAVSMSPPKNCRGPAPEHLILCWVVNELKNTLSLIISSPRKSNLLVFCQQQNRFYLFRQFFSCPQIKVSNQSDWLVPFAISQRRRFINRLSVINVIHFAITCPKLYLWGETNTDTIQKDTALLQRMRRNGNKVSHSKNTFIEEFLRSSFPFRVHLRVGNENKKQQRRRQSVLRNGSTPEMGLVKKPTEMNLLLPLVLYLRASLAVFFLPVASVLLFH